MPKTGCRRIDGTDDKDIPRARSVPRREPIENVHASEDERAAGRASARRRSARTERRPAQTCHYRSRRPGSAGGRHRPGSALTACKEVTFSSREGLEATIGFGQPGNGVRLLPADRASAGRTATDGAAAATDGAGVPRRAAPRVERTLLSLGGCISALRQRWLERRVSICLADTNLFRDTALAASFRIANGRAGSTPQVAPLRPWCAAWAAGACVPPQELARADALRRHGCVRQRAGAGATARRGRVCVARFAVWLG